MKFVLMGTGNISETYVNAVDNLEEAEITAVVSRNEERAESYARQNGIPRFGDSLAAISCDYEAVIVATPNGLHHKGAVSAAGLGKHVLVEKPLDITPGNMDKMITACDEAGVKLGVCFQRRLHETNIAIKNLLDRGAFGEIYAIDLPLKFYRGQSYYDSGAWRGTAELDGGGPFMQQGSHDIDLLGWLFGMPEKVFAKTGTFGHSDIDVEDHGAAILELKDGAICTITASTIAKPGFSPRLDVFTEKGTFSLENDSLVLWQIDGVERPACLDSDCDQKHNAATSAKVTDTSGHEAIIKDFISAVEQDHKPTVSGERARVTTDLILSIYRSAREGKEIVL